MASKITMDMIKPFTGEGDVVSWLKKVTLVAKLQKIVDLASFIPLYLEGDALALYLEMGDEDQECAAKIQEKLKVAFSDDPFSAFGKLVQLKWTGEPVDVYANEIRRLAGLAKFDKVGLENVMKLMFVNGFPDNISVALQQLPNVMTMAMSELISHARILSSKQQGGVLAVTVRKGGEGGGAKHENRARPFQFRGCGKRVKGDYCACSRPFDDKKVHLDTLPIIDVWIGNLTAKGLVDTGCSTFVVHSKFVPCCKGEVYISAFDGSHIKCKVADCVELGVNGECVTVRAVVSNQLVNGVDVVLGVDVIDQLRGVTVTQGKVCFGAFGVASVGQEIKHRLCGERDNNSSTVVIGDPNFHARFYGQKWTVRWFWENNETVTLQKKVSCYDKKLDGWKKEEFENEVDRWIAEGILVPWKEKVDIGIIPLMAVKQPTKNKVRPVLDFRELIVNVKCHTGDDVTDVCSETLRKWRPTAFADEVIRHLNTFGLITKSPESINGGAALGLQLQRVGGELMFQRATLREEPQEHVVEDPVGEQSMMMVKEVIERVKLDDPVRGNWCVPSVKHGVVWCDASKIAMGVVLEINGKIAKDAAWLRKKDDFNHINVAELEAVLKGVNLAIRWGLESIEVRTDSATVGAWLKFIVSAEKRVDTKGAAEMIIKRRLGTLKELITEFGLNIVVQMVPSKKKKADILTGV
ncbi:uncharacterized protein [Palaemon carinicauda]|uniref:uncharacterized protein n=1 Tax=Palaemon carinicauda TaxID=392227 RepID=UPI0035B69C0C